MGYDIIIRAARPIPGGKWEQVMSGLSYCSRIRNLVDIFAALVPFGISREAPEFSWFQFHQAREDVQVQFWKNYQDNDDHETQIPHALLFEPQQVKASLSLLLHTAQQNGLTKSQNFYRFEVHAPDETVFKHDYLHVVTYFQRWDLKAGLDFCIATTLMNAEGEYLSRPLQENWLLNHAVGDELIQGYVYVRDGIIPYTGLK